jgi:hypothetical protein
MIIEVFIPSVMLHNYQNSYTVPFFLTLAIGIYMLKSLGSVNKVFSRNF